MQKKALDLSKEKRFNLDLLAQPSSNKVSPQNPTLDQPTQPSKRL